MKKKIFFIAVVLLVVNLIWLPYIAPPKKEKKQIEDYLQLNQLYLENRIEVAKDFELYCLPDMDLVLKKVEWGTQFWDSYGRQSLLASKLLWTKELEPNKQLAIRENQLLLIDRKEPIIRYKEGRDKHSFRLLIQDTFNIDRRTGETELLGYTLVENEFIYWFDFSEYWDDTRKKIGERNEGGNIVKEVLPYQESLDFWVKSTKSWSWFNFFDKKNKRYYESKNKTYYQLIDQMKWLDHSDYSMLIYDLGGTPKQLDVAIFDKKNSVQLLDHYVLRGKKIVKLIYENGKLKKRTLVADTAIVTDEGNSPNERQRSGVIPNTTWAYSTLNDTIVLENKNLKYIQKIILPTGTNFMQTILLEQNSWVFYIKTNTTLDKYVVPLAEVPTKEL